METKPRRLRTPRLIRPPRVLDWRAHMAEAEEAAERDFLRSGRATPMKIARAVRRVSAVLLWILVAIPIQAVCLALPGRPKIWFARTFWAMQCRLVGLRVRVIGEVARAPAGRAVVFVSNHSSWLDIAALGGVLEACFVAKREVSEWPIVRRVARLGRTVFVSRRRGETARERDEMRARLAAGDNLILFPEGTTSDGCRVLPFRSAFFSAVEGETPPIVQPVTVVYDLLAGLPAGRRTRPVLAWYGDMDIGSHFWRLTQHRDYRVTIVLHRPVEPADFPDRKALAAACWQAVAEGAAALRQNRAVTSGETAGPSPAPAPAFA